MTGLLGVDTASSRLSIAVRRADGQVAEREVTGARRHAGALAPLVEEALAELSLPLAALAGVVVSDGPGSFTGLRVAAAFAKGLARPRRLPLWTVSTLMVRAAGALGASGQSGGLVVGVGSALRGELYAGAYRFRASGVETAMAPRVLAPGGPLPLADPVALVVGDVEPALLDGWPWTGGARRLGPPAGLPRALALLDLVGRPGGAHRIDDPASWEPCYGRPAEAQAKWERTHGRPLVVPHRHA